MPNISIQIVHKQQKFRKITPQPFFCYRFCNTFAQKSGVKLCKNYRASLLDFVIQAIFVEFYAKCIIYTNYFVKITIGTFFKM